MLPIHTLKMPDGAGPSAEAGALMVGMQLSVANAVGGGAGQAVTVAVTGLKNLPAKYGVMVSPGQDATWFVSSKTSTGFTVTLNPRLAANTLAAGTIDLLIFA